MSIGKVGVLEGVFVVPFIVGTLAGLALAGGAAVFAKRTLLEDALDRTGGYF